MSTITYLGPYDQLEVEGVFFVKDTPTPAPDEIVDALKEREDVRIGDEDVFQSHITEEKE